MLKKLPKVKQLSMDPRYEKLLKEHERTLVDQTMLKKLPKIKQVQIDPMLHKKYKNTLKEMIKEVKKNKPKKTRVKKNKEDRLLAEITRIVDDLKDNPGKEETILGDDLAVVNNMGSYDVLDMSSQDDDEGEVVLYGATKDQAIEYVFDHYKTKKYIYIYIYKFF